MNRKKVLMVMNSLDNGGIEKVVFNIIKNINRKKYEPVIYLVAESKLYYYEKINELNIEINIDYVKKSKCVTKNKRILLFSEFRNYLKKNNDIDIVHIHCHNESPSILLACKAEKISCICMHSHNATSKYSKLSFKEKIMRLPYKLIINICATKKIGCSAIACRDMYGKHAKYKVLYNSIDFNYFNIDKYPSKNELKKKYGLDKKNINLIFVGRFVEQKNIIYLVNVFYHLQINNNVFLTIVGYGPLEYKLKAEIKRLGIDNNVKILPGDSCVPELLKASDIFIGPSIYEGLGLVFVEAQIMGIPAFASDVVPKETDLGLCFYPNLESGINHYAEEIENYIKKKHILKINENQKNKYKIDTIIKELEEIYEYK